MKTLKALKAHISTKCKHNYVHLIVHTPQGSSLRKPFTFKKGIIPDEQWNYADESNREDNEDILLINALTNKLEKISMQSVIQMQVITKDDDPEYNTTCHQEWKGRLDTAMGSVDKDCCKVSDVDLLQKFQEYGEETFSVMCIFDHAIDDDAIIDPTINIEGAQLLAARECWVKLIRKFRKAAFDELDALEESTSDRDELADIDTIKQMFRDIPQDIDLSELKSVEQIVNFWPPLLLPVPPEIDTFRKYIHRTKSSTLEIDEDIEHVQSCLQVVSVDKLGELKDLHDSLTSAQQHVPDQFLSLIKARIEELS